MSQAFPDLFSREALAGYDHQVLDGAVVCIVGCGAAGNNIAHALALSGVRELRFLDPDTVEPSNLPRSPLFRRERLAGTTTRWKARELALGALSTSYASDPVARFASVRVEHLGLGGLTGCTAVVSAADAFGVRAYLADVTRLLRVPLVEIGFSAPRGHVSVFQNREPNEPCWRCLHPEVESTTGGISCTLYARRVAASGRVPATQTVASALGSVAAEAVVQALHGRFPLGGRMLQMNVQTGEGSVIAISRDPQCPGSHRVLGEPHRIGVSTDDPLERVFAAVRDFIARPLIIPPAPIVESAPCEHCGARVDIGRPAWRIAEPPACKVCRPEPHGDPAPATVATAVGEDSQLARMKCRRVGLLPGAIFEIEDDITNVRHVVRLAGESRDAYTTLSRRNGDSAPDMEGVEAAAVAAKE